MQEKSLQIEEPILVLSCLVWKDNTRDTEVAQPHMQHLVLFGERVSWPGQGCFQPSLPHWEWPQHRCLSPCSISDVASHPCFALYLTLPLLHLGHHSISLFWHWHCSGLLLYIILPSGFAEGTGHHLCPHSQQCSPQEGFFCPPSAQDQCDPSPSGSAVVITLVWCLASDQAAPKWWERGLCLLLWVAHRVVSLFEDGKIKFSI